VSENDHHTTPVRPLNGVRRRETESSSWKTGLLLIGFIVVAGLSYLAGTLQLEMQGIIGRSSGELDVSSLQDTYHTLADNYDGKIDQQALIEGANRGMVEAVGDDYTIYLNADETDEFNKSLSGDIGGGVGIEVGLRNGQPTVLRTLRDNPAEKAGVRAGDVIVGVNGDSVVGSTVNDVVALIRGEEGTTVQLSLLRDGEEVEISVTREIVNNPSVYSSIEDGVGIMTITRFDDDTGRLARDVARQFQDAKVKKVILDLRGNGGGYVSAAKDVASLWLDDKLIVTERRGDKVTDEIRSSGSPILGGVKTVVLIDANSASASEIVAGALHDHHAATLLGETSFGKGSVQQLLNLPDGATLKVTVARWYTPAGVNISEKGITPDKAIEFTPEDRDAGRDPQLEAAKAQLAK